MEKQSLRLSKVNWVLALIVIFALGLCSQCSKPIDNHNEVIIQFLNEQKDPRMYVPPPPPGSNDSTYYNGKRKADSIISNLEPLIIYVNDSIRYSATIQLKTDFPEGFNFIQEIPISSDQAEHIDISTLSTDGIDDPYFQSIQPSEIENILSRVRYEDNYGGIISFYNLVFSENQDKAYFEVHYFMGKLNASNHAIYAEFKNGKWTFKSQLLSIS